MKRTQEWLGKKVDKSNVKPQGSQGTTGHGGRGQNQPASTSDTSLLVAKHMASSSGGADDLEPPEKITGAMEKPLQRVKTKKRSRRKR